MLEVGVERMFAEGSVNNIYLQDLKLLIENTVFYISSAHVRTAMKKYSIPITWKSYKRYEVEAENLQEATEKALRQFHSEPDENYLDDSFNIDREIEEETKEKIDFERLNNSL